MTTRIMLVDDHAIVRAGLNSLIEKEPDLQVIGMARDGQEALQLVEQLSPDVVIMDISMPKLNGVDATRHIVRDFNQTKVIALSVHSNKRFVDDMLRAGASGYVLKECLFQELGKAIRTAIAGGVYLSPGVTGTVVDDYKTKLANAGDEVERSILTDRERDVLQLLAEGKTTKQIALDLHISNKTVESRRRKIMEKLDIHSVAELTKYAVREGLTSIDS